eukprot:NODE_1310_length_2526_cov_10.775740.p1 GENE.NODE_1310_length_2526_cov_10.775740~~NODE_1310_length_2526_cov_10.775740.p1  ORF type:complete len:828 (-),score=210.43 NODE_1310_length_2526_cov_10.775740:41-2221(-)
MLGSRNRALELARTLSEVVERLKAATLQQLLCSACRGGGPEELLLADAEARLAAEWHAISREAAQLYYDLWAMDAAVAAQLRAAGRPECVPELAESLRRGLLAPSAHAIALRPWTLGQSHGRLGFRDVWRRWLDGHVAFACELAEGILAERDGLAHAFLYMLQPGSPAHGLLVRSPHEELELQAIHRPPRNRLPLLASPVNGPKPRVLLVVVLPYTHTDFTLTDVEESPAISIDAILAALRPLHALGRAIIVAGKSDHVSSLGQALEALEAHDGVTLVWHRHDLFHVDELASLQVLPSVGRGDASSLVGVLHLPADGNVAGLVSAVEFLTSPQLGAWPPPLRPARPSHWPELVALHPSHSAMAHRTTPDDPCPASATVLAEYLSFHAMAVERLRAGGSERVLVYRCSAMGVCGGHADRLHGLLGAFLLAVASRRAFFIDAPRPIPLPLLLTPRRRPPSTSEFFLDWQMHGAIATPGRVFNYMGRWDSFIADLPHLLVEQAREPVMVLKTNERVTAPLLDSPTARALMGSATADALLSMPYLHADLLELLFEPSPLLAQRFAQVSSAAYVGRTRLIAMHLRVGNRSPHRWLDPARHSLSDLDALFDCASKIEAQMGWTDSEVAWYLAADTMDVVDVPRFVELHARGKLAFLPAGHGDMAVMHVDRSSLEVAVQGITDTWAQWLTISVADAVVLSHSGFGHLAAEAGRLRNAFLGSSHGCVPADLTTP